MTYKIVKSGDKWVGMVYDEDGNVQRVTKQCRDRREVNKQFKKVH